MHVERCECEIPSLVWTLERKPGDQEILTQWPFECANIRSQSCVVKLWKFAVSILSGFRILYRIP